MLTYKYHFGIQFPSDFPFTDDQCYQLALHLFANPFTSYYESRNIINNINVFPSKQYVLNTLKQQLSKVLTNYCTNESHILEAFNKKSIRWFSIYSFPQISEVNTVLEISKFPQELILEFLIDALINNNLGHEKVIEFLSRFLTILNEDSINKVLDYYNLANNKCQIAASKYGIQTTLF